MHVPHLPASTMINSFTSSEVILLTANLLAELINLTSTNESGPGCRQCVSTERMQAQWLLVIIYTLLAASNRNHMGRSECARLNASILAIPRLSGRCNNSVKAPLILARLHASIFQISRSTSNLMPRQMTPQLKEHKMVKSSKLLCL